MKDLLLTEREKLIFLNMSPYSADPSFPIIAHEPWFPPSSPRSPQEEALWESFRAYQRCFPEVRCLADILRPRFLYQGPGRIDGHPITPAMLHGIITSRGGQEARDIAVALLEQPHLGEAVYHHSISLIQRSENPRQTAIQWGFPSWLVDHEDSVRRPLFLPQ